MKRNSLFWFSELVILVGLVFWIIPTFFAEGLDIFLLLSPEEVESVATNPFVRLGWGIVGAVMVGMGILFLAINQKGSIGLWSTKNLMYASVEVWYILDGITSIITGFYFNVISNTGFLMLGILAIRSSYSDK